MCILLTSWFFVEEFKWKKKLNSTWLISPLTRRIFNEHANADASRQCKHLCVVGSQLQPNLIRVKESRRRANVAGILLSINFLQLRTNKLYNAFSNQQFIRINKCKFCTWNYSYSPFCTLLQIEFFYKFFSLKFQAIVIKIKSNVKLYQNFIGCM